MPMTADARRSLSAAIRGLRERLVRELRDALDSQWQLGLPLPPPDGPAAGDDTIYARLDAATTARRRRFETGLAERARAADRGRQTPTAETIARLRAEAELRAGATLLNRVVFLRMLEADDTPLSTGRPRKPIVTGGRNSAVYRDFRDVAPAFVDPDDPTEGYAWLLERAFTELALDLPGLYGDAGLPDLIPIPPQTLFAVVDALDAPALASCWTDELTPGWIYQYWNDPAREALDAKLNAGGKVEPHEIASKTQMFTERYIVDWLLQNSLGAMWLAICAHDDNRWTPEATPVIAALDARRADWRAKRDAGEVELTALMPLHSDMERRWAYYVPREVTADDVKHAPRSDGDDTFPSVKANEPSVTAIKLVDPACGSGHFLVVAFDLLFALHKEEARHRGVADDPAWSDKAIVEHILSSCLHGLDIDPRAVQIAAAALWLKARRHAPDAEPERLNLVASDLGLSGLPQDDPALLELQRAVEAETGVPAELIRKVVDGLKGADHLGSLLKVDAAVRDAIRLHEQPVGRSSGSQGDLFGGGFEAEQLSADFERKREKVREALDRFLAAHTRSDELGLRLRGRQLAAGVRFVELIEEGQYDLVVGNPPYQNARRMSQTKYFQTQYLLGKADLYSAFLLRGLELVREGGVSALLTMRSWLFIQQFSDLRLHILQEHQLLSIGDFAIGAFDCVENDLLSVSVSAIRRGQAETTEARAQQPTPHDEKAYDRGRTPRKRSATLCGQGCFSFRLDLIKQIPLSPFVFWWPSESVQEYLSSPLVGEQSPSRNGVCTTDNGRFLRTWHELPAGGVFLSTNESEGKWKTYGWHPLIKGADGRRWFEGLRDTINWSRNGLELKALVESKDGTVSRKVANESRYMRIAIACATIGDTFSARRYRFRSIFDVSGASVFPPAEDQPEWLCLLNTRRAASIAMDFSGGLSFASEDINRLPVSPVEGADAIYAALDAAFTEHESHREPSVEFRRPGPSPWDHAQAWAQAAVDRPAGEPLPDYTAQYVDEPATDHLSYALGVALGRFHPDGEGILDPIADDISHALPDGILWLDGTLTADDHRDGLGHPAAAPLHSTWNTHGHAIDRKRSLRAWLSEKFFALHRSMYDRKPIHWPLTSERSTFVAWITIHRLTADTLRALQARWLNPTLKRLDGALLDIAAAREGEDPAAAKAAAARHADVRSARDELAAFIEAVSTLAEKGPPPLAKVPEREVDARYAPVLDDGVMINSAPLWPLLAPQWKDPRKWWIELARAKGRKDYDWSQLARRYWPERVERKCVKDPSLAVAHRCFWHRHPAKAFAWELRLQHPDEIGPGFAIDEPAYATVGGDSVPGSDTLRARFLMQQTDDALEVIYTEVLRRKRKEKRIIPALTVEAPGLWISDPAACVALETRLRKKQNKKKAKTQIPFVLHAPDEAEGRAKFAEENPTAGAVQQEM